MSRIQLKKRFSDKLLIVFDGDCPFCSKQIHFIERYNTNNTFLYVPRSSKAGQEIRHITKLENLESLLFINNTNVYTESDAIVQLFRQLPYPFRFIYWGRVIPNFIRDFGYKIIAKYRQKIPIKFCSFNKKIKENILESF